MECRISGMTCQPSAQTSIPGLYPPGRAFVHSADPMSKRFGHPDSQIPTPSDGSVEQVTYPLAICGAGAPVDAGL